MKSTSLKICNFSEMPMIKYQTEGSVGMDLMANVNEPVIVKAGEYAMIPTGIGIQLQEGQEAQVRGRSGLAAKKGILVHTGTIDSDYRGEIGVILFNLGKEDFVINRHDRIAQLVIAEVLHANLELVGSPEELEQTERGAGGFGHTGV